MVKFSFIFFTFEPTIECDVNKTTVFVFTRIYKRRPYKIALRTILKKTYGINCRPDLKMPNSAVKSNDVLLIINPQICRPKVLILSNGGGGGIVTPSVRP